MISILSPILILMLAAPANTPVTAKPADTRTASRTAVPAPGAPAGRGDYVIGPEDVLDISVWNNTTISRTVPVRPDGMISLPLLNDVRASGLTPLQLRDDLMKRLTEYMPNPEVSVILREVHSAKVSVVGYVKKPGRFELKAGSTVLDMIALAEGVNEFAAPSRIVVLRNENGQTRKIPFNYKKVTSGGDQENFLLRPGDIIVVP